MRGRNCREGSGSQRNIVFGEIFTIDLRNRRQLI